MTADLTARKKNVKQIFLDHWLQLTEQERQELCGKAAREVAYSNVFSEQLGVDHQEVAELSRKFDSVHVSTDSFDWTGEGMGAHVDFNRTDELPLDFGEQIGRGATSDVHEALCQGVRVAVKRRRVYRNSDKDFFTQEMKKLKRVSGHDHVVKIVGSFTHNRIIGILLWPVAISDLAAFMYDMDALCGYPRRPGHAHMDDIRDLLDDDSWIRLIKLDVLHQSLRTNDSCDSNPCPGAWDFAAGLERLDQLFGCLSGALAYIHGQKIKHKDLKPTNILLTTNGVYLTDFGTSTDFSEITVSTTDGGLRGTPRYFAPEVADYRPSGRAADIFSLGCIFVEIAWVSLQLPLRRLQNFLPHRDHSYQANLDHVETWIGYNETPYSQAFADLVKSMLSYEPQARPRADQVVAKLYELRRQLPQTYNESHAPFFCPHCVRKQQAFEGSTLTKQVEETPWSTRVADLKLEEWKVPKRKARRKDKTKAERIAIANIS